MKRFHPDIKLNSIKEITPELLRKKGIKYALLSDLVGGVMTPPYCVYF